ncbi:hypothetical protein, partial [Photobacterium phosphoreum]|uniref:hypothetical protein n=1 Tax=Photobacterium phosphoreum TaxID=659 RepID=UPI0024B7CD29
LVFKTSAFNRSAISPMPRIIARLADTVKLKFKEKDQQLIFCTIVILYRLFEHKKADKLSAFENYK